MDFESAIALFIALTTAWLFVDLLFSDERDD